MERGNAANKKLSKSIGRRELAKIGYKPPTDERIIKK